jgi:multidrug efflux system membrane fusion protein
MLAFRKAVGILVSLIALAGLLVTVVLATRRIDQRPRTDDAYLQADLVHMAPDVSGRIVELDVRDNQAVRKGDVLFRIDPDPYRMRVDQARAAVRGLEAKLALIADQVAAQTSKAGAAAIAKLSALIPTMVYELAKADFTPILEARPQVAQELCRALARRQAAGRLSVSPELDESVPKHRLTSWFPDRIHRLYDLANAE